MQRILPLALIASEKPTFHHAQPLLDVRVEFMKLRGIVSSEKSIDRFGFILEPVGNGYQRVLLPEAGNLSKFNETGQQKERIAGNQRGYRDRQHGFRVAAEYDTRQESSNGQRRLETNRSGKETKGKQ